MSDDPICEACGHPRSNHPYRHPFVGPSRDNTIKQQADRIEELEVKLDKAVETLEFYGDERNYESEYIPDECGCCGSWYEPKIHKDGQDSGDKARSTLAELTGGKDDNP